LELVHVAIDWILSWQGSPYALAALFVFAFWESSFFPLPPDPLLIAMAIAEPRMAPWYAAVCTAASVLGAILGYFIGRIGGRPLVDRFFKQDKVEAAEGMYQRFDVWAVGAAAFTPIPYKVFTITAGVARLDMPRFVLASLVGRGGRFFSLGLAIYLFGPSIQRAIDNYFELLTVGFLVLLVGGFIAIRYAGLYLSRRQKSGQKKIPD